MQILRLFRHDCAVESLAVDPSKIRILVVDRDSKTASAVRKILRPIGYQVSAPANESAALRLAETELFNLVIYSTDAECIDPVAFMQKIRAITPDTQFIFLSEDGTVRSAVDAMRKGAFEYLAKPVDAPHLVESVCRALEHQSLVAEDQQLKLRLRRRSEPDIFAGRSSAMQEIDQLIRQIAGTEVVVLIEGESGTGKEIVARAIHERSRRKDAAFIAVNCAALPDNLIEAEFFGHVRGAFTGAIGDRPGRFQLAQGGTLFLDEIGDLSSKGQGDLLRVLEDGIFRPVGSHKLERANARIVAATNKNLEEASASGRFREDLFYRLNIITISIPPLRERVEDIPSLVKSFAAHFCAKHNRRDKKFDSDVIAYLQTLRWPGNVRQLRNLVERMVVTVPRSVIEMDHLPKGFVRAAPSNQAFTVEAGMSIAHVEAELIRQTLQKVTANRGKAAGLLGISRRALQYKIARYGLEGLPNSRPRKERGDHSHFKSPASPPELA